MNDFRIVLGLSIAVLTFCLTFLYRAIWRRYASHVPTGFGIILPVALLAGTIVDRSPPGLQRALLASAAASFLYWIDDLFGLPARVRMTIAAVTGLVIAWSYLDGILNHGWVVLGICYAAVAIVLVIITNIVNFYDGADLNLATYVALTAGILLIYVPFVSGWATVALAMLCFAAAFGAVNYTPRTLYLGDGGSFAFACFVVILGVAFLTRPDTVPPESAVPSALPALDVFFVFTIRVREKHDLLTRNYLHLYQRLSRRYRGFGYLLPQLLNTMLCLGAAAILQSVGLSRTQAVIMAMLGITTLFYFLCRRLFLRDVQNMVP